MLSKLFLNATYNKLQNAGAAIILVGAVVSVLPSIMDKPGDDTAPLEPWHNHHHHSHGEGDLELEQSLDPSLGDSVRHLASSVRSATSMAGVVIFLLSIVPGSFSNVYKEHAFKSAENSVDIYYMTTWVTLAQVITGFLFMPLQNLPALGGVPWSDLWQQMIDGNMCMWGKNPRPGDDCSGAGVIMLWYVAINFVYNIFSLLVVKHGNANLSVVTAAIALPLTNMSFSWRLVMGKDYEPFQNTNLLATAIVLGGFILYSKGDDLGSASDSAAVLSPKSAHRMVEEKGKKGKVLGLAAAGGSVMYMRPRSDSDPTTPGYTPMMQQGYRKGRGGVGASPAYYGSTAQISIGESVPFVNGGVAEGDEFEPSSV